MENSAASSDVQVSNQSVEGFEIDSEELLEVSESGGDSEYLVREEEPSRNSRLGLGDENIEGRKSTKLCFISCLFIGY